MNSVNIPSKDIKKFMNCLLVGDTFDKFLLEEASITTFNTFTIDGHVQSDFYSEEELASLADSTLSSWANIKPICFNLIKGNSFHLDLK
jgi:hypothetical protein